MAVVGFEIKSKQLVAGGKEFDGVGAYEQLDGVAHFAVDPANPLNSSITDIQLAPRDNEGRVRFSADVRILAAVDSERGNHRLFFDVPNRGNRVATRMFNRGPVNADP